MPTEEHSSARGMPRWPGAMAVLTIGAMLLVAPEWLSLGPRWLLLALTPVLLLPLFVAHRRHNHQLARGLAFTLVAIVTTAVASSAIFLVTRLPAGRTPAPLLLGNAALIWVANVLAFAVWYWEIDAGGPAQRAREQYTSEDFLFPQIAVGGGKASGWTPSFVDYLFLAFNTSTAFSPTDTLVLSRRAKLLMMAQSIISLVVIAVLAARAVNTF